MWVGVRVGARAGGSIREVWDMHDAASARLDPEGAGVQEQIEGLLDMS